MQKYSKEKTMNKQNNKAKVQTTVNVIVEVEVEAILECNVEIENGRIAVVPESVQEVRLSDDSVKEIERLVKERLGEALEPDENPWG